MSARYVYGNYNNNHNNNDSNNSRHHLTDLKAQEIIINASQEQLKTTKTGSRIVAQSNRLTDRRTDGERPTIVWPLIRMASEKVKTTTTTASTSTANTVCKYNCAQWQ
ncbi:unnamed protein product [Ceratitis capitata]|uniref:(Mediterranean fruit fly) hypothetical protein n=1 Tax=Ceratitis capitata TaxID=7213 RepID=A0A811V621_CERCA|nr:unnamed protein product [Ceratitis capitata]